ncbi:MAG: NUDIX hydrolase [Candidatus Marinimicrobia bacterium]|nr:NUDIX hydrolase [Candidatus Neomarinimicrobiota bacterium]
MNEPVKLLNEFKLFQGNQFNVVERDFSLPGIKNVKKEIIISKAIIVVVPVLDKNQIILINQYRFGAKTYLLELPAGTVKNDEELLDCANRELEEETGYTAAKFEKINFILFITRNKYRTCPLLYCNEFEKD